MTTGLKGAGTSPVLTRLVSEVISMISRTGKDHFPLKMMEHSLTRMISVMFQVERGTSRKEM